MNPITGITQVIGSSRRSSGSAGRSPTRRSSSIARRTHRPKSRRRRAISTALPARS